MPTTYTDTTVNNLIVNVLDKNTYEGLTPNTDELYLITDDGSDEPLNIEAGIGISIDIDSEGTSVITNTAPIWHDDIESSEGDDYVISILKSIYPVGSIYMNVNNVNPSTFIPNTTWELISNVALASEHVFGNEYNLGVTDGTILSGLRANKPSSDTFLFMGGGSYGVKSPTITGGSGTGYSDPSMGIGVVTKTQTGDHPEYSGLTADTITIYTWKRTI